MSIFAISKSYFKTPVLSSNEINIIRVSGFASIVCALNLRKIADILSHSSIWAFSLATDASTHYDRSYLDNRIRVISQWSRDG